jgi:hypothetical protein
MATSRMPADTLHYAVLVYEDSFGTWVKIPEFDAQCLTEDWQVGLGILEEQLLFELNERRLRGECVPEQVVRTVHRVGRADYGPTQVELATERHLRGRATGPDD